LISGVQAGGPFMFGPRCTRILIFPGPQSDCFDFAHARKSYRSFLHGRTACRAAGCRNLNRGRGWDCLQPIRGQGGNGPAEDERRNFGEAAPRPFIGGMGRPRADLQRSRPCAEEVGRPSCPQAMGRQRATSCQVGTHSVSKTRFNYENVQATFRGRRGWKNRKPIEKRLTKKVDRQPRQTNTLAAAGTTCARSQSRFFVRRRGLQKKWGQAPRFDAIFHRVLRGSGLGAQSSICFTTPRSENHMKTFSRPTVCARWQGTFSADAASPPRRGGRGGRRPGRIESAGIRFTTASSAAKRTWSSSSTGQSEARAGADSHRGRRRPSRPRSTAA